MDEYKRGYTAALMWILRQINKYTTRVEIEGMLIEVLTEIKENAKENKSGENKGERTVHKD